MRTFGFMQRGLVVFCSILFAFSGFTQEGNWEMVNQTREKNNYLPHSIPFPFVEVMYYPTAGPVAGITYKDGLLYVTNNSEPNMLEVFDAVSGVRLWSRVVSGSGGSNSFVPAVGDSVVVLGGQSGPGLYFLDRFNGDSIALAPVGSMYARNVLVDGELIYFQKDRIYCNYISDGSPKWSRPIKGAIASTPAVDDEYVYVCEKDTVAKYNKLNSAVSWRVAISSDNYPSLSVADSLIYVGSKQFMRALRKEDGSIKWTYDLGEEYRLISVSAGAWSLSPDAVVMKAYYSEDKSFKLINLNRVTGEENWSRAIGESYYPPLINGDQVTELNRLGYLVVYDLVTGDSLYRHNTFNRIYNEEMIVADNTIFIGAFSQVIALKSVTTANEALSVPSINWNVFPNPSHAMVQIQFTGTLNREATVDLIDLQGRIVSRHLLTGPKSELLSISIQGHAPGVYFLRMQTTNSVQTRKLIVQ